MAEKLLGLKTLLIFVRNTLNLVAGSSFPFFLFETMKKLSDCFFLSGTAVRTVKVSVANLSCADAAIEKELINNARMGMGVDGLIIVDLSFCNKPILPPRGLLTEFQQAYHRFSCLVVMKSAHIYPVCGIQWAITKP